MNEVNQIRLENLLNIDRAILNNHPLEEIVEIAIDGLCKLFPNSWISVSQYIPSEDAFKVLAVKSEKQHPQWQPGQKMPVSNMAGLEKIKLGSAFELENIETIKFGYPDENILLQEKVLSCLVVPLVVNESLFGIMHIGKRENTAFQEQKQQLLTAYANQLAISFQRAYLNNQNQQQKEELDTLLEISKVLARSLDLNRVMQVAVERAIEVLKMDIGAIYLLRELSLYLGASTPPIPPTSDEISRTALIEHHPHIQKSITTGEIIFIKDTSKVELTPQEKAAYERRGFVSLLFIPLFIGARAIGILTMGTVQRTWEFSQHEIDLCQALSSQMASAIENAHLHHKIQQHAKELEKNVQQRTAELEALTYAISHDLRAPLRAITGFGNLLEEDYSQLLPEDGLQILQRMVGASQQLERMMEALLSLTNMRKRQDNVESIDLSALAERLVSELMRTETDRQVQYSSQNLDPAHKIFVGDQGYIEILLSNLLSNAMKFTRGKEIAKIEFGCTVQNNQPVYYVKDNGVGFNQDLNQELFLPFRRLHSNDEFPGSGIGMTIAKRIIELHNGDIWIESKKNVGTTVYFRMEPLRK